MFNGIIFNQGIVKKIIKRPKGINIFIKSDLKLNNKNLGVSISCDGVCLTLISIKKKIAEFYLSNETLKRSKFRSLKLKDKINLELPLKYGHKISGHICQGHVDTVGKRYEHTHYSQKETHTLQLPAFVLSNIVSC